VVDIEGWWSWQLVMVSVSGGMVVVFVDLSFPFPFGRCGSWDGGDAVTSRGGC
jgi:hypothetical protein